MTSARTTLTRWGNALGVWLYRHSDGRITGPSNGTTIGLLTGLRGWTPQQYETWLADVIDRLLPGPDQPT